MTININSTSNYSTYDDQTALVLCNKVSRAINGCDAQDSGNNPIKAEILDELNSAQKEVCNKLDWNFLKKTVEVDGFETETTTGTVLTYKTPLVSENIVFSSDILNSNTDRAAQKMTVLANGLPKSVSFSIIPWIGFGIVEAEVRALIVTDINDLSNPLVTSDKLLITNLDFANLTSYSLPFTSADNILIANNTYWIVFEFTYASTNGATFQFLANTESVTDNVKYYLFNNPVWTSVNGYNLQLSYEYYDADFVDSLTIPLNIQKVFRLYQGGTYSSPITNLLPYAGDKFINAPDELPYNTFMVKTYETTGQQVIFIKTSASNIQHWIIEYKQKANTLTDDDDIPVIPSNYRDVIVYMAIDYFMGVRGYGLQDAQGLARINNKVQEYLKSMRRELIAHPAKSFKPSFGSATPQLYDNNDNVSNRYYNNTRTVTDED